MSCHMIHGKRQMGGRSDGKREKGQGKDFCGHGAAANEDCNRIDVPGVQTTLSARHAVPGTDESARHHWFWCTLHFDIGESLITERRHFTALLFFSKAGQRLGVGQFFHYDEIERS